MAEKRGTAVIPATAGIQSVDPRLRGGDEEGDVGHGDPTLLDRGGTMGAGPWPAGGRALYCPVCGSLPDPCTECVMSIDRTLRLKSTLERHRNVLTRAERIELLKSHEQWNEGASVLGLPKVSHRKAKAGKKKAKAEGTEAAAS